MRIHLDREGNSGAVFHPSADWLREHDFPEAFANVVKYSGGKQVHYALQNEQEFFAEMSEAWWELPVSSRKE